MVEEHIFVSNIAILDETVPVIYIFTSYLNKDTRIQRIHESNRSRTIQGFIENEVLSENAQPSYRRGFSLPIGIGEPSFPDETVFSGSLSLTHRGQGAAE